MRGDAATDALGQGSSPACFLCGEVQHGEHARLFCEQSLTEVIRIFVTRVRDFVEEGFDGKAGVGMTYGAPPLDRDTNPGRMQIDLEVGDAVEQIGRTFD